MENVKWNSIKNQNEHQQSKNEKKNHPPSSLTKTEESPE